MNNSISYNDILKDIIQDAYSDIFNDINIIKFKTLLYKNIINYIENNKNNKNNLLLYQNLLINLKKKYSSDKYDLLFIQNLDIITMNLYHVNTLDFIKFFNESRKLKLINSEQTKYIDNHIHYLIANKKYNLQQSIYNFKNIHLLISLYYEIINI